MQLFISHNVANKADARLLAVAAAERGLGVWFDEWNIRPGESIAAGIESGLMQSDAFVLIWSAGAACSKWVGTEIRAYIHRRVADATLRIVPVMLDETPLPVLVADYRGFRITSPDDFSTVAGQLSGTPSNVEVATLLQKRLWELAAGKIPEGSPHKYVVCPQCGSPNLEQTKRFNPYNDKWIYAVTCMEEKCKFHRVEFVD